MSTTVEKIVKENMDQILKSFNRSLKLKGLSDQIAISEIHFTEPNALRTNCHEVRSCKRVKDPVTGTFKTICSSETVCD